MSSEFFRTRMGQRFYEATMPKIADQLERLNANLETLVAELRALRAQHGGGHAAAKARESSHPDPKDHGALSQPGPTRGS